MLYTMELELGVSGGPRAGPERAQAKNVPASIRRRLKSLNGAVFAFAVVAWLVRSVRSLIWRSVTSVPGGTGVVWAAGVVASAACPGEASIGTGASATAVLLAGAGSVELLLGSLAAGPSTRPLVGGGFVD
jgi:hypothetical protein